MNADRFDVQQTKNLKTLLGVIFRSKIGNFKTFITPKANLVKSHSYKLSQRGTMDSKKVKLFVLTSSQVDLESLRAK